MIMAGPNEKAKRGEKSETKSNSVEAKVGALCKKLQVESGQRKNECRKKTIEKQEA